MPMGQWGGQMLLVDWFAETLEEGPWEAGCHSGPGTWLERHVGTALMIDLKENEREKGKNDESKIIKNFHKFKLSKNFQK